MILILKTAFSIMTKRITIVLDDDLIIKLRKIQAEQIKNTSSSVSFSKIINEVLRKSTK